MSRPRERVEIVYPLGYKGEAIDFAFLVDSFYYMKKTVYGKQLYEYLPEVLAEIYKETGLVCMAVCSGGAQLVGPGKDAATYDELLAHVPFGLKGARGHHLWERCVQSIAEERL